MIKGFAHRKKFMGISITGRKCWLMCKFCRGFYLKNMLDAHGPKLKLENLYNRGVRGILLSGGFRKDGTLPIEEYIPILREFKLAHSEFVINGHLGLLKDVNVISELKDIVDVIDYEFNLNQNYLFLRNLAFKPDVYIKSLDRYLDAGLYVVPHVILDYPSFNEEIMIKELKSISDRDVDTITMLVFIPTPSTEFKSYKVDPKKVIKHVELARRYFNGEIYLGCMRPLSVKRSLDIYVAKEGIVKRIANPHHEVSNYVDVKMYDACCSLPEKLLNRFKIEA